MPARALLINAGKALFSVALIAWALYRIDLGELRDELSSAQWPFVFAALVFFAGSIMTNGLKWHVLVRAQDASVPLLPVVGNEWLSYFLNIFLPGAGGDMGRAYGLAHYTGRAAPAVVSVVIDLLIGLTAHVFTAAIATLGVVAFAGVALSPAGPATRRELLSVGWVALGVLLVMLVAVGLLLSGKARGLVSSLFERRPVRFLHDPWESASQALEVYGRRRARLALAFALALVGVLLVSLTIWSVSQAMGGLMHFRDVLIFTPLITLVVMLPISVGSGLGVTQNVYPFFYGLVGVPAGHALAVSVVVQVVVTVASLPGGFFWPRRRSRKTAFPDLPPGAV